MKTTTAIERAKIAEYNYGIDLTKDYFELDGNELTMLDRCYRATGYNGNNNQGRSRQRQFWYYLQWGWKKYQEQLRKGAH